MKNHLHFSVNTFIGFFLKEGWTLEGEQVLKDRAGHPVHDQSCSYSIAFHKTLKTLLEPADIFSLYPLGEVIILSSASRCRKLRNLIFAPHSTLANPVEGKGPSSFRGLAWASLRSQGLALREWAGGAGQAAGPVHCPWPLP